MFAHFILTHVNMAVVLHGYFVIVIYVLFPPTKNVSASAVVALFFEHNTIITCNMF